MVKAVIGNTTQQEITNPQAHWDRTKFDDAIQDHGYRTYIERALKCPCAVAGVGDQPLTDCENCGGTGWCYIDRQESIVLATSISNRNKYEVWTQENMGTINITCKPQDKLGYMDKLIFLELESWFNEVLHIRTNEAGNANFAFTVYEPVTIFHAYLFTNSNTKYRKLTSNDYSIDGNKIIVNDNVIEDIENPTITIRYTHNPVYYILDINRDLIKQKKMTSCKDVGQVTNFPLSCIGRRAHYVLDAKNFDGERLLDNTDYESPVNYDI